MATIKQLYVILQNKAKDKRINKKTKKIKITKKPPTVGHPQSQIDRRLEGGARPRQSTQ